MVSVDRDAAVAARTAPVKESPASAAARERVVLRALATLAAVAVAAVLGWFGWRAYMGAPWTRDGTVRAYVVTIAPQVAGQILELPARDNAFVHKGDLLMQIDPASYAIAVRQAEAGVAQAKAVAQNAEAEWARRQKLNDLAVTVEEQQVYASKSLSAAAQYQLALADLDNARLNLKRARIVSPVNGYVTNLQARAGRLRQRGQRQISVIDADSFWVDAYFEETFLEAIRDGAAASVKLMGYPQILKGHVQGVRTRHQRAERRVVLVGAGDGQPDLRVRPARPARAGPHPARVGPERRPARRWHDGDGPDRRRGREDDGRGNAFACQGRCRRRTRPRGGRRGAFACKTPPPRRRPRWPLRRPRRGQHRPRRVGACNGRRRGGRGFARTGGEGRGRHPAAPVDRRKRDACDTAIAAADRRPGVAAGGRQVPPAAIGGQCGEERGEGDRFRPGVRPHAGHRLAGPAAGSCAEHATPPRAHLAAQRPAVSRSAPAEAIGASALTERRRSARVRPRASPGPAAQPLEKIRERGSAGPAQSAIANCADTPH